MTEMLKEGAIRPVATESRGVRARRPRSSPWGPLLDRTMAGPRTALMPSPDADAAPASPDLAHGLIERRLARRAEALWARLPTGSSGLPESAAAGPLLAPPFASHALLVGLAPHDGNGPDDGPRILHVGSALAALAAAATGSAASFGDAPLTARLVALARDAAAAGRPVHLDSDEPEAGAAASIGLVWRAIALPFAGSGTAGPTVLVIASWRRRLSAAETAALHRELAAAIEWMHRQRPGQPIR